MDNRGRGSGGPRRQSQAGPNYASKRREMAMRRERERKRRNAMRLGMVALVLVIFIGAAVLLIRTLFGGNNDNNQAVTPAVTSSADPTASTGVGGDLTANVPDYSDGMKVPEAVESTAVDKLGIEKQLQVNGQQVDTYDRAEKINFSAGSNYTQLEGVISFRGNNYRDAPTYGTADVTIKQLTKKWEGATGGLGKWTGSGWTGQPLIVKWPEETKQIMNLYDDKKNKADLVEVIYAAMSGKIHFFDLEDGTPTRDAIDIGQPFKGAGSLDPRGYPMIFLGSGVKVGEEKLGEQKAFIYSLIDGKQLHSFGDNDDFALRDFTAWDSSALVCADTDTLIYPGENGVLYTMKLNTKYDPAAGTLEINPSEEVKMRYTNARYRQSMEDQSNQYWLGMESSAVVWKHYLYIADNCGDLICVDLNTMKVVWAADTLDDTNCTPVMEIEEDGQGYIYLSTSLHWTQNASRAGTLGFWKFNATTGEKVQEFKFDCYTVPDVSGGVQATALIGKHSISDLIIFPVARTPKESNGVLYALDKKTLEKKYEYKLETLHGVGGYSWSSPIAIYDKEGNAYIIICNTEGYMILLDSQLNEIQKLRLGNSERAGQEDEFSAIEASPAAFNNMIVVGSRGQRVFGVEIQ